MPLSYYGLLPRLPVFAQPAADNAGDIALITEKKQNDTVLRMNSLSEALARLSDVIYTLSDRLRRPGIIDLKQICDSSFDRHCSRCSLASLCLERECTSTLDAQSKITTELYTKGRIELDSVPGFLRERCYNIGNIVSEINLDTAALVEKLIRSDKTEAFALDYESLSKLLNESISENDMEYRIDAELTEKLRRSLRYMDMPQARALCWGARRKQVILNGVELAGIRLGADEIRRAVENTLQTRLTRPKFNIEGENVEVSMSVRRRFNVENARATSVKESESANGDTALMFETREDYFYTMISDGMGSGREAAVTSKLCRIFVEQLLSGGNGKAVTLEMLNGFIRSRGNECSATVDLAEIDLITGHACFIKSGAAPSFVLRNGNLYKLQSKTVPIGIMPALDAEQIKFDLTEGDIIIMLSDGVAQSLEDGVWLANLLTYEWENNLQLMAEKIIDNAALNNKRSDDMTAALVRISEYVEE
jgi:stage II sporulation protein E